ncbi:hypothetical protein [Pseudarthrobacter sp. NamE5]|uniref:hypothetical protein n=1 Tax=Pseudarthrobacter sp. NamE5 TaxID=2576839 RepID=UPI00110AAE64|nr:hypothetical protein [Pseudarthrobacter sp. NamE5]TLM87470.1 hypothetical protein FDW84_02360 [Pseudarthrobacter sp. NamE5]
MSQEQPPIRSRRELRKARDAQQATMPTGAEQVSPAAKPTATRTSVATTPATTPPATTPPAATPPGPTPPAATPPGPRAAGAAAGQAAAQRSSQIRARDRAALRTIKELEEKEGQLAAGGPPTRRQLRLQQLKEQALTAANPIVPPASGASDPPPASAPTAPAASVAPAEAGNRKPRSGGKKGDGAGEPGSQGGKAPSQPGAGSAAPEGMTVEQALAARALIAEQAKNQLAKMEHIASLDPEAVDPEILAEQIALAERAAVMNRRAMAKQKLAEQAGAPLPAKDPAPAPAGKQDQHGKKDQGAGQRPGPSTANNLAMVTPLEFVQVPGIDRPVMKRPATSHVPVTTRPGTKVTPSRTKKPRPAAPQRPAPTDGGSGRSNVIARAEAAARAAARPQTVRTEESLGEDLFEELPRVPASSAHGLEPLDAATAGLARAKRNRVLQLCILAFGVVALVSGVLLIISGMSS